MKGLLVLALVAIAACGAQDDEPLHVSSSWHVQSFSDGRPAIHTLNIEFTLPRGFTLEEAFRSSRDVTLIDQAGRRFQAIRANRQQSERRERFSASFEVREDSELHLLQMGEYEVDLRKERIRRAEARRSTATR